MQFFWLYIDDLVGKGLDFLTIMQLVGLVAINTITLSLPLSLLFSSIIIILSFTSLIPPSYSSLCLIGLPSILFRLLFLNIDLISEEISNKRLNICYSCKELIRLTTECRQSKNFMFKETKIKNTKCPLRKW